MVIEHPFLLDYQRHFLDFNMQIVNYNCHDFLLEIFGETSLNSGLNHALNLILQDFQFVAYYFTFGSQPIYQLALNFDILKTENQLFC